jgi:hypothetical protein
MPLGIKIVHTDLRKVLLKPILLLELPLQASPQSGVAEHHVCLFVLDSCVGCTQDGTERGQDGTEREGEGG